MLKADVITGAGSPPRVREKQDPVVHFFSLWGITPASAGKTCVISANKPSGKDHPRECGKNLTTDWQFYDVEGSPPRVREKHIQAFNHIICARITPASAGKTKRNIQFF